MDIVHLIGSFADSEGSNKGKLSGQNGHSRFVTRMETTYHIQTQDSYLLTVDNYFPVAYANELFELCKKLDLIIEPEMKMGTAHRCMNFYSNVSKGYEFSNQIMEAQPIPDFLLKFLNCANTSLKTQFNGILINYYRDGSDNLGAHSDNEKGLYSMTRYISSSDQNGQVRFETFNGMVAAMTLMNPGGTRKFRIRDKHAGDAMLMDILTKHNQLLVMGGDFQKHFKHEVPAEKRNKLAERVSITLRYHKD